VVEAGSNVSKTFRSCLLTPPWFSAVIFTVDLTLLSSPPFSLPSFSAVYSRSHPTFKYGVLGFPPFLPHARSTFLVLCVYKILDPRLWGKPPSPATIPFCFNGFGVIFSPSRRPFFVFSILFSVFLFFSLLSKKF